MAAYRVRRVCRYKQETYSKGWGRWQAVLVRLREWAVIHDPDFPYLADLPEDEPAPIIATGIEPSTASQPYWASNERRRRVRYGPFLTFGSATCAYQ
jgi:hypothetical protein